jgi:hypothetical protein
MKKRNEDLGISLNLDEQRLYKMSAPELREEKQKQSSIYRCKPGFHCG